MGLVINSIGIGFLSAIFISLYAQGFFEISLPVWIIYGMLAPMISALIIVIGIADKKSTKTTDWWQKEKNSSSAS